MEAENERRQRLYRVTAIVLKRRDQGEADRLLTVLARERGKVTLLAKGVRRQASRKAGHLEPFTYVELLVAKGKSLDIVTQAETVEAHRQSARGFVAQFVGLLCRRTGRRVRPGRRPEPNPLRPAPRDARPAGPRGRPAAGGALLRGASALAGRLPAAAFPLRPVPRTAAAGGQLPQPGARRLPVSAARRQPPGNPRAAAARAESAALPANARPGRRSRRCKSPRRP